MFFFKHHAEHEAGRLVLDLLFVFLKLYRRSKQVLSNLVLIYFGITSLLHTIKTNCMTFQIVDPEICSIFL